MLEWYYILGMIAYGIFILQTILSIVIGDFDFDIDFDGNVDFDGSDILSFKGLIHFLMGFSGWLMLADKFQTTFPLIGNMWGAVLVGLVLMIVLYYTYKFCYKLRSEGTHLEKEGLVDLVGTVYLAGDCYYYITVDIGGCTTELKVYCNDHVFKKGDKVIIKSYKDGKYYI